MLRATRSDFHSIIIITVMMLIIAAACLLCLSDPVYAANSEFLQNGQSYDISKAKKNTIVYIDDETAGGKGGRGTVELTGSSTYVWVHIALSEGTTVTVNLADGLSIKPGKNSASGTGGTFDTLGHSRSGIYIDETKKAGGIVILKSEKGAKITIGSYKSWFYGTVPAIMKNNTKTKLVFDTADKSDPGTIIAKPSDSGGNGAAGIGAFGHGVLGTATSSYTVGNIEFYGGNIEAYGNDDGPGIGAYEFSHVGEISFIGGHVIAKAGNQWANIEFQGGAAGIGTTYKGDVGKINILGGYVEAWGYGAGNDEKGRPLKYIPDNCGCGIGTALYGDLGEINISGGTVIAHGGSGSHDKGSMSGCGIGTQVGLSSDSSDSTADKINISGGDITAIGADYACGIGGCVKDITIAPATADTDLKINAYIEDKVARGGRHHTTGSGIGTAGNVNAKMYSKYPGNITIRGGDITATAGPLGDRGYYADGDIFLGAGIGPTRWGRATSITITGGKIKAEGGWSSPGIGGTNDSSYKDNHGIVDNIHISGGTITATKATDHARNASLSGIGGYKNSKGDRTDIRITGGSVIANGSDYAIGFVEAGQPENDSDETVYGTKFKFNPDIGEWTRIDSFKLDPSLDYDYGLGDVYSKKGLDDEGDENIVEFWIPKSKDPSGYNCTINTGSRRYGSFDAAFEPARLQAGSTGTLSAYTDITYVNKINKDRYTGFGVYGSDKLTITPAPAIIPRYSLTGYSDTAENMKMVANGAYNQTQASPLVQGTEYVGSDAKWNARYTDLTLYMMLEQTDYLVSYDANKPKTSSTAMEGTMKDDSFSVQGTHPLSQNKYSLAGWEFTGWNTKADGSGSAYSDGDEISFDPAWGDKLTLYAQWKPKTYTITFRSGDAGIASVHSQTNLEFDRKYNFDTIASIGWNYPEHSFHGWSTSAFGSFYEDGEEFTNLCTLDPNGDPTGMEFVAEWVGNGSIRVSTTVDGVPTTIADSLLLSSDTQRVTLASGAAGRYEASLSGLPFGSYQLAIPGDSDYIIPKDKQQIRDLTETSSVSIVIDYYTVTMEKDDHIASAYVKETGTSDPHKQMEVPDDYDVVIGAAAKAGYHVDGYSYYGVEPVWDDPSVAEQRIRVTGKVTLTAHAEANLYHAAFRQNRPENASHQVEGSMQRQDFIYDEPQELTAGGYSLTGWTFKSWNTKADGTGTSVSDQQNMTDAVWVTLGPPENDAEVALYAQWEPNSYNVLFSATNATSGEMKPQGFIYDTSQALTANAFERTDWHFTGWNTEPAGGGTAFADGQEVRNLTTGKSITLYAQWEHDYYTVKFDKNDPDAAGSMEEEHVWTNTEYQLPLCEFSKMGYYLDSWNTEADGSGTKYADGEAIENAAPKGETMTLYAQWKPNTYTVRFDANTGSGTMAAQAFTYDKAQPLTPCSFRKAHCIFTGWNTLKDGSGTSYKDTELVSNLTPYPSDTMTLYAQWQKQEPQTQVITYDLNGGSLNGKTGTVTVTCKYGDTITLPKPTREGYTFDYWKGSKYHAGDQYKVTEDHTFTAVWQSGEAPTGDHTNLSLCLLLLLSSGIVLLAVLVKRRA